MLTKSQEAELITRARQGDTHAFTQLVAPLRERIYRRAVKAVRDLDQAEDVTQEALLRSFTRLETFRGDSRFSTWVYSVTSNCILMHLRKRKRIAALCLKAEQTSQPTLEIPRKLPDEKVMEKQMFLGIEQAMSQLPSQYGEVLRLWVEESMTLKDIHDECGLSRGAIKSRIYRARKKVKSTLDNEYGQGALLPV